MITHKNVIAMLSGLVYLVQKVFHISWYNTWYIYYTQTDVYAVYQPSCIKEEV